MPSFFATLSYELDPLTAPDARKLLKAELAGRRYNDRHHGQLLPVDTVWIRRTSEPSENVDDLMKKCGAELLEALASVRRTGRKIELIRAWIQISGAGTYGLVMPDGTVHE